VGELSVGDNLKYLSTKQSLPILAQTLLWYMQNTELTVAHMKIVLQLTVKYCIHYTL